VAIRETRVGPAARLGGGRAGVVGLEKRARRGGRSRKRWRDESSGVPGRQQWGRLRGGKSGGCHAQAMGAMCLEQERRLVGTADAEAEGGGQDEGSLLRFDCIEFVSTYSLRVDGRQ